MLVVPLRHLPANVPPLHVRTESPSPSMLATALLNYKISCTSEGLTGSEGQSARLSAVSEREQVGDQNQGENTGAGSCTEGQRTQACQARFRGYQHRAEPWELSTAALAAARPPRRAPAAGKAPPAGPPGTRPPPPPGQRGCSALPGSAERGAGWEGGRVGARAGGRVEGGGGSRTALGESSAGLHARGVHAAPPQRCVCTSTQLFLPHLERCQAYM